MDGLRPQGQDLLARELDVALKGQLNLRLVQRERTRRSKRAPPVSATPRVIRTKGRLEAVPEAIYTLEAQSHQ